MTKQLYPSPRRAARRELRQARRETRRWMVAYDLAYDGGGSKWSGHYRTRIGSRVAAFWHVRVASWGGTAVLTDTESTT